jgi:hypothetical protein
MEEKNNKISPNSVSLAGEFAVLSQLSLRGLDANMTLGHTKNVDILVSDPKTNKMYQLEVKTNNYCKDTSCLCESKIFGKYVSDWIMSEKHEKIFRPGLFYCFVGINKETNIFRYFIIPSDVVAKYVMDEHKYWVEIKKKEKAKVKLETGMRLFRIGFETEKYNIDTPTIERYENNWSFQK